LVAEPESDPSIVSSAQSVLAKVRKVLLDGPTDLSLDELLAKAETLSMIHTTKP